MGAHRGRNDRKREEKNIRKIIKLIDSNLYATKGNSRHKKKKTENIQQERKLALRKFFAAAERKPPRVEQRASGICTICSMTGTGRSVLYAVADPFT